ncbi:T9SS type A sorting domain-containing protein [Chryseobacterium chendengshani]|uniref:T9SS type A sorting domain-containing protein n=1 Tax=Chryseobacterium sp. LJ756 TaxID=2864113 RepID=UPI001C63C7C7|nr:T9SS type A sorting domain-containing protein [Chryseobacterium sp. LJ756]MBW7676942.1 T9SS type A sorting domain-containing protein [Chryseobacterium sp. LJ756]
MKKNLFTIGLIALSYSVHAQNILLHVGDTANMYVSKGTLVYNGGGMQMKGTGVLENHGNVMVSGSATDSFKTIDAANADKTEATGGGNFVNKLNENASYNSPGVSSVYTYGQLFISGIPQTNITGIVDQEFRAINHGTYQQIGLPFYDKTVSTLSTELGKTFSNTRYSQNEVLTWDNATVVSKNVPVTTKLGVTNPGTAYYMLGGLGLNVSSLTRTLKGRPLTDIGTTVTLQNAGSTVTFGTNGNNTNQYNEKYNTYLQDAFDAGSGVWQGTYGKNIYQFANPFMTNLDLSRIAITEAAVIGDGINLTTIRGLRLEVSGVTTTQAGGTGSSSYKFITFASGVPTGDVRDMMVRPLGTFVIKLNNNTAVNPNNLLNFANLRRFNYTPRAATTDYGITANKNVDTGTVKQLGVIGLDVNGDEVGRTYYVVYPNGSTGHSSNALTQVTNSSSSILGTFEEALTGGYDNNFTSLYWLYINEANENTFQGKNIKLVNYDLNTIKSYKFEIRENAELVSTGTHQLSTGIGFYYKAPNGTVMAANQDAVIPVTGSEYDLYYGLPDSVLNTETTTAKPSRTMVIYNPEITNYIVRFDPYWKKADIEVFDMSGKLVISKKSVNTSSDFVIELDHSLKNSYIVKIVSDKGETVNTKILK